MAQGYTVVSATSGGPALTINTPTTVLAVIGSSGPNCEVVEWGCAFDYNAASTGNLPFVEFCGLDAATTGTFTAKTPVQIYGFTGSAAVSPNTTARANYTVEPTNVTVLATYPGNVGTIQSPLGREYATHNTTGLSGKGYSIRVSVPSSSMLPYAFMKIEE